MPNNEKIVVGSPSQTAATGAIRRAPLGTAAPTDASVALDEAYTAGGYVDDGGVNLTTDISTTDIKEWGGALVRRIIDEFKGEVTFTYLEFADIESLKQQYGDDYVISDTAKKKLKLAIGNHLWKIQSWCIDIKDGDTKVRLYVPKGQVTSNGDISFVANDAVKSETTLTCYDDGTGNSLYIFVDGEAVAL